MDEVEDGFFFVAGFFFEAADGFVSIHEFFGIGTGGYNLVDASNDPFFYGFCVGKVGGDFPVVFSFPFEDCFTVDSREPGAKADVAVGFVVEDIDHVILFFFGMCHYSLYFIQMYKIF